MDNMFFWGGLAILAAAFALAWVVKRRKSAGRKPDDPSDIYPMW